MRPSVFLQCWWGLAESGERPDAATLAMALEDRDRSLLFEIGSLKPPPRSTWEEAESCLVVLRRRRAEEELAVVQKQIEPQAAAAGAGGEMRRLPGAQTGASLQGGLTLRFGSDADPK